MNWLSFLLEIVSFLAPKLKSIAVDQLEAEKAKFAGNTFVLGVIDEVEKLVQAA